MSDDKGVVVPIWTLATSDVEPPSVGMDDTMSAERLTELRSALAAFIDEPIATLEVHALPPNTDRKRGIALDAASPLAQHLSQLISQSAKSTSAVVSASAGGEALFKMVVPAKFAADISRGLVKPMVAKGVSDAIRGPLVGPTGVVGHAAFVQVSESSAALSGGAAAAAAVSGGAALTVAAPLVLMAVAVGASAAAEHQRQVAIEHITQLLEELHEHLLDEERNELDGCRESIDKATVILLDEGKLGVALGLDSAVHEISKALAAANRRVERWKKALNSLSDPNSVDVDEITEAFPGVDTEGGRFRAHLEIAALAIALKRRVIVLQAVESAQLNPGNLLANFSRAIKADERNLETLEAGIAEVLMRLSRIQLARPKGLHSPVVTSGEADRLLRVAYRIRALGDGIHFDTKPTDVAIDIVRNNDGSVVVLPARAV